MYFDRDDVALPKFSTFFLERSMKERDQAEKLLEYQNMRGGQILLQTIAVSPVFVVSFSSLYFLNVYIYSSKYQLSILETK